MKKGKKLGIIVLATLVVVVSVFLIKNENLFVELSNSLAALSIQWTKISDTFNSNECIGGTVIKTGQTFTFQGKVLNNLDTSSWTIVKGAYHNPTARNPDGSLNCTKTTTSVIGGLTASGVTTFKPGDQQSGFTLSYNTSTKNCGRVQLDASFRQNKNPRDKSDEPIVGVVLNYGKNCSTATPTPAPTTSAPPNLTCTQRGLSISASNPVATTDNRYIVTYTISWNGGGTVTFNSGIRSFKGLVSPATVNELNYVVGKNYNYTATIDGTACTKTGTISSPPSLPPPSICALSMTTAVDKATVKVGGTVTYTLTFKNIGPTKCTGGGVQVEDVFDNGRLTYVSESHSTNGLAGYNGPALDGNTVRWDYNDLLPGESGWTKVVTKVKTGANGIIYNSGRASAKELNWKWVYGNMVETSIQ